MYPFRRPPVPAVAVTLFFSLVPAVYAAIGKTPAPQPPPPSRTENPVSATTTIIVVRHAEKDDSDPGDPSLSDAGRARASALAATLDGADVGAIYTTQFKRTRETAEPLAKRFKVAVSVRPIGTANMAANQTTYADRLAREVLARDAGKTVVVVGHSNTVPDLIKAFGARPPAPLGDGDYDRLFIVVRPASGPARLIQARYGAPDAR